MSNSIFKEYKKRNLNTITDKVNLDKILSAYFNERTVYLKHTYPIVTLLSKKYNPEKGLIIETTETLPDKIIFYTIIDRYIEIIAHLNGHIEGNFYLLNVSEIRIANEIRHNNRILVKNEQVIINNIITTKNMLDVSYLNLPTSIKIHFNQLEQRLKSKADFVQIKPFEEGDDLKLTHIQKTGKILFLDDTQNLTSYYPANKEDYVDFHNLLQEKIGETMRVYQNKSIVSEIIIPIVYLNSNMSSNSIGYIQLLSKSKKFTLDLIIELKSLTFEIIDLIKGSNTLTIEAKEIVKNISPSGLQLQIQDPELKKILLHQKTLKFDIIFKRQTSLTLFNNIVYTILLENGNFFMGVEFDKIQNTKNSFKIYQDILKEFLKINI